MMSVRTVPELLTHSAAAHGHRPAVVEGDTIMTYTDLRRAAFDVARAYRALGVEAGDRIALWVPNRSEFILALLGAQVLGASVVPLNTRYRGPEAHAILRRSRAVVVVLAGGFLDTDYLGMLTRAGGAEEVGEAPVVPGLPHLRTVVDLADAPAETTLGWSAFLTGGDRVPLDEVERFAAAVEPTTVCDILFTSGTTGEPKGVMSTHAQTLGVAEVWARAARLGPTDRYGVVNPFFHSFGYKAGVITSFTAGTAVHPVLTFDPVGLLAQIQDERITVLPGAPTIFTTLINHPRRPEFDLSSLRFATAGSASVPENLFQQMQDVLGFDTVAQAYGLTECVVATQSRPDEDPRHVAETTGPIVAGLEGRVVDEEGRDVAVGTDGEIWLRGENVMLGYFEDQEATDAAIDPQGWLHTGDVGRFDHHGCLKITDRIKDMFTVGGFNVYPAEVENAVSEHPAVMECAVVGVPDDRLGSVGHAFVLLRPGRTVQVADLSAWSRERLANFKVPRRFEVVGELPRNIGGKVLKEELRRVAPATG